MPLPIVIETIRRLSQQEGMNDAEIADYLDCSRATVNRARNEHSISKADLSNKRDKRYRCQHCGKEVVIRRKERRRLYCQDCEEKNQNNQRVN